MLVNGTHTELGPTKGRNGHTAYQLSYVWQGGRVKGKRKRREILFASVTEKLLVRCSFEMQLKRVDKLNKFHAYPCPKPGTCSTVDLRFESF